MLFARLMLYNIVFVLLHNPQCLSSWCNTLFLIYWTPFQNVLPNHNVHGKLSNVCKTKRLQFQYKAIVDSASTFIFSFIARYFQLITLRLNAGSDFLKSSERYSYYYLIVQKENSLGDKWNILEQVDRLWDRVQRHYIEDLRDHVCIKMWWEEAGEELFE